MENTQSKILNAFKENIKKDFLYNIEEFKKGNINLMFIVGFSGSGKTTLSRIARKIPNVEVIEHDLIDASSFLQSYQIKEQGSLFFNFWEDCHECYNNKDFDRVYYTFNKYAIEYAKNHKDKVFIIEGTRSLNSFLKWNNNIKEKFILPKEHLKNIAIIIKGTSLLKSYFRALKRNSTHRNIFRAEKEKNWFKIIRKFFKTLFNKRRWNYYKNAKRWFKEIKNIINSLLCV